MGGHILDQALPNPIMEQLDPFLLIHHAEWQYKGNQRQKEVGIGPHPHRGFSPVTFVFQGDLRHQDSFGNDKIVNAGGTQWMHAGKGITHSERPSSELAKNGGTQEIIQFWVNTPAKHKMELPYYLPINEEDTPKLMSEAYQIQIIAGSYEGKTGPAKTFSPMTLLRGTIKKNGTITLDLPKEYNTLLYLLDGELIVNNKNVKRKDMISFALDGTQIDIEAQEDTRFILLSGEPINEEVTSYGPFVMNNQTEILQAMRDAQIGKMGILIENFE